jgi:hypothetical protein
MREIDARKEQAWVAESAIIAGMTVQVTLHKG